MVIDDEEAMRITYSDELTREGYEVITTSVISGALDLIDREKPELILLGVGIGKRDTLDLIQNIRDRYFGLPLIFLTAYPNFKCGLRSTYGNNYVINASNLEQLKQKIERIDKGSKEIHSPNHNNDIRETKSIPTVQINLFGK